MVQITVFLLIGVVIGILIGVSFGIKLRAEIKSGFDNLTKQVATELTKLGEAIKAKL